MLDGSTIVAPATAPGRAARALVRLSGPATGPVLDALFTGAPAPRGAAPARLSLGAGRTLPVLLIRYAAPASYTGEDAAEVLLPGNPALVERLIDRLLDHPGVRRAGPGEFSARAYLHGRLTLAQADGVAALVAAATEAQWRAARDLLAGAAGREYAAWADELARLLALVEAGIDFADQEGVVAVSDAEARRRVGALAGAIRARLGSAAGEEARAGLPRVVLAGEPNAGKSTLFNALLGRRRAVVSPRAGTTRDALAEPLDLSAQAPGAGPVLLIDLAGLDEGAGGPDAAAQARAREEIGRADAVVYCDPHGRFPPLAGVRGAVLRVRTKADQPGAPDEPGSIPLCAIDGWNLGALRRAIADAAAGAAGAAGAGGGESDLVPRHRRALREALGALEEAQGVLARGGGAAEPEVVAAALRAALDALGELTGRITPDDVLGRVFATFCIGK